LKFADAAGQVTVLPKIAGDEALHPYDNPSSTRTILE
jgi:hypothetical protein